MLFRQRRDRKRKEKTNTTQIISQKLRKCRNISHKISIKMKKEHKHKTTANNEIKLNRDGKTFLLFVCLFFSVQNAILYTGTKRERERIHKHTHTHRKKELYNIDYLFFSSI